MSVEGELAEDLAGVVVDDADVQVVDEQADVGADEVGSQADVAQATGSAQGDVAGGVDLVRLI